jgi:hypothetical protein
LHPRGETKKIYFARGESKEKKIIEGKNKTCTHYRGYQLIYPYLFKVLLYYGGTLQENAILLAYFFKGYWRPGPSVS